MLSRRALSFCSLSLSLCLSLCLPLSLSLSLALRSLRRTAGAERQKAGSPRPRACSSRALCSNLHVNRSLSTSALLSLKEFSQLISPLQHLECSWATPLPVFSKSPPRQVLFISECPCATACALHLLGKDGASAGRLRPRLSEKLSHREREREREREAERQQRERERESRTITRNLRFTSP